MRHWEWHYLKRLCHADLLTLRGHTWNVISAAYTPDGKRIVSASHDGTGRLWDAETGREVLQFQADRNGGYRLAISPDGNYLATSGRAQDVRLWNTATGTPVITLTDHPQPLRGLSFSPDGRRLATSSADTTVRVWDLGGCHTNVGTLAAEFRTST
jgi:WD40 repeat protein